MDTYIDGDCHDTLVQRKPLVFQQERKKGKKRRQCQEAKQLHAMPDNFHVTVCAASMSSFAWLRIDQRCGHLRSENPPFEASYLES